MKKLLFLLFIVITSFSFSQKKKPFKTGVILIQIQKDSSYSKPESVLFEFSGHTHLINFYKDLSKKIKKSFKRSKIKTAFNYNLIDGNFEKHYIIKINNFKKFNNNDDDVHKRKQQFNLEINLQEKGKTISHATLKVNTLFTILTQNKAVSKEIYRIISSK